jgi:hypothetical protein
MPTGKYEKKKEPCPSCGKVAWLPLHRCKAGQESPQGQGESQGAPGDNPIVAGETGETGHYEPEEITYKDSPEVHPDFETDNSLGGKVKRGIKRISEHAEKYKDSARIMTEAEFKDFIKMVSDSAFDLFSQKHLQFTEDELKMLVPDMYYLLKKWFPDLLRWLRSDIMRAIRLLLNIVKLVKIKQLQHKVFAGEKPKEELDKEVDDIMKTPEMEQLKGMFDQFGVSMNDIKTKIKEIKDENGGKPLKDIVRKNKIKRPAPVIPIKHENAKPSE